MENLGWDNIAEINSTMPPTIWTNQYYVNFSESGTKYSIIGSKMEFNEALLNSSLELHGDSIDLDRVNEMAEMLAPAFAFGSITDHASDPCHFLEHHQEAMRFAADSVLSSHQLSSLPPTVIPEQLGTNQELESFHRDDGISVFLPNFSTYSGNFSSSGESEAISQGSPQADSSKRKLEDHQHSSNFLPMSRGFEIFFDSEPESKKSRITEKESVSANIDFRQENKLGYEPDTEAIAQVKQMIYRAAALRPVNLILEEVGAVEKPKRKNVRISSDPQTVAARHRRERISDRLRILQKLVPGGSKMDTASMLDEAANYLKFLKTQVTALETLAAQ